MAPVVTGQALALVRVSEREPEREPERELERVLVLELLVLKAMGQEPVTGQAPAMRSRP